MKYDVVIRCKNEMEWLPRVITSLKKQNLKYTNIIFVDNGSKDGSLEYAVAQGCKIIHYDRVEYNYSYALNIGIRATTKEHILILSAHCELKTEDSVLNMIQISEKYNAAGVYGRQIPTINSSPLDTRDLVTTFGREEIVFKSHPFFHNAFSIIRKSAWERVEFDEGCNGIEDRIWAVEQAKLGQKIVYTPESLVLHEHGLNQGGSDVRARRVCKALEVFHSDDVFEWPIFDKKN